MMKKPFSLLVVLAFCWILAEARKPDWAKPFLKMPVPAGSYISPEDEWVALHSEIVVGLDRDDFLRRTYRQVLAPLGDRPRTLSVMIRFDEATETLVEPRLWVPGIIGYREVELKKSGRSRADYESRYITDSRYLYVTTEEIDPDEKAVLHWEVRNRLEFPGEDVLFPFDRYPSAEWSLRIEPRSDGAVPLAALSMPYGPDHDSRQLPGEDGLDWKEVPAIQRLYDMRDPWLPHVLDALPSVLVSYRAPAAGRESWPDLARLAVEKMRPPDRPGGATWEETLSTLLKGAETRREKIASLARFTQDLTYRNIEWGEGGYIPEPPLETLRTRSGDCKAKALLLKTMLEEIEVPSRMVICQNQSRYLEAPETPTLRAFNHVVLAIKIPGGEESPAALLEGPGTGWVLFDPTHPLLALGEPPSTLEGSQALWMDQEEGDLFTVRTRVKGAKRIRARLDLVLDSETSATFSLRVEGESSLAFAAGYRHSQAGSADALRGTVREELGPSGSGLEIESASFSPPDHVEGLPPVLSIAGTMKNPLQSLGSRLRTMAGPTSLLGTVLGVPRIGFRPGMRIAVGAGVDTRVFPPTVPCCQGRNVILDGEIRITLPPQMELDSPPRLERIDSPWLMAETVPGDAWRVRAEIPRGRFPPGSEAARVKDLDSLAALFRKPFVIRALTQETRGGTKAGPSPPASRATDFRIDSSQPHPSGFGH